MRCNKPQLLSKQWSLLVTVSYWECWGSFITCCQVGSYFCRAKQAHKQLKTGSTVFFSVNKKEMQKQQIISYNLNATDCGFLIYSSRASNR